MAVKIWIDKMMKKIKKCQSKTRSRNKYQLCRDSEHIIGNPSRFWELADGTWKVAKNIPIEKKNLKLLVNIKSWVSDHINSFQS